MSLGSQRELEVTREKLRGLEELYAKTAAAPAENAQHASNPLLAP